MSSNKIQYNRISSGLVDSNNYELVKIINGKIEAIFQVRGESFILVVTNDYLWKVNNNGYVIDTKK